MVNYIKEFLLFYPFFFTDSFLYLFCYWVHFVSLKIFQIQNILVLKYPFALSLYILFIYWNFLCLCWGYIFFSFVSSMIINACGNIFMITALKSLSDNPNICVTSILASADCLFLFHLLFSSFLVWWMVFSGNLDTVYVMRLWISFRTALQQALMSLWCHDIPVNWRESLLYDYQKGWVGGNCYSPVMVQHKSRLLTQLLLAGWGRTSLFPVVFGWRRAVTV